MFEPVTFRAGDTWSWLRSLADYPAPDWTLTAVIKSATCNASATATAEGSDHRVAFAASATASIAAGTYTLVEVVTKAAERYTVGEGALVVLPNPLAAGNADLRGPMRKALDDARAKLAAYAASGAWTAAEYEILGRRRKAATPADLRRLIAVLEVEVAREDAAASGAERFRVGRSVAVRFGS